MERARGLGFDLEEMVRQGNLRVIYLRPLDLSPDETLQEIRESVGQLGATRVVIDSLSGFELALAPTFRQDFRESLYRLVGALTGVGITVLTTMEIVQSHTDLRFTSSVISFLADDILLLRYAEIEGRLKKVLVVVKMRGSDHSAELRAYEITARGLVVGEALRGRAGIITGVTEQRAGSGARLSYPGLIEQELVVVQALIGLGEAPAEALARQTGLRSARVARALDRLVELGYAAQLRRDDTIVYRPVARGDEQ